MRRALLRAALVAACPIAVRAGEPGASAGASLGSLVPPGAPGALGVTLGAEEAARTARLLGRRLALRPLAAAAPRRAERLLGARRLAALIVASDGPQARAAARDDCAVVAVGDVPAADAGDGSMRVFSVAPGDRAAIDALALHLVEAERARRWYAPGGAATVRRQALAAAARAVDAELVRDAAGADAVWLLEADGGVPAGSLLALPFAERRAPADTRRALRVTRWHHTLEPFGAAQLNQRFARRFGRPMDGVEWGGWMAVKAVWDALARRPAGSRDVAAALASGMRFDGHKGAGLAFGPDGRLRQPLYVVGRAGPGDDERVLRRVG